MEKAEELDDKIKVNPTEAKKVTSQADSEALEEPAIMFDADEIEISFADKVTERELSEELKELESATKDEAVAAKDVKSPSKQQEELMQKILEAKKRFNRKFFMNCAYEGPHASALSQRDLEQHLSELSGADKELLILSMINQAYELNDIIPNIEMVFFRMFMSPIITKAEKKKGERDDLLAGNLFHQKSDFKMPKQGYDSLLQSVALNPKKKHFKKILQFLVLNEDPQEVPADLIDKITFIGIDQRYPVLLGSTIKYFLQNNFNVRKNTLLNFVMFLERSKGFEEDAKRFLLLTNEREDI